MSISAAISAKRGADCIDLTDSPDRPDRSPKRSKVDSASDEQPGLPRPVSAASGEGSSQASLQTRNVRPMAESAVDAANASAPKPAGIPMSSEAQKLSQMLSSCQSPWGFGYARMSVPITGGYGYGGLSVPVAPHAPMGPGAAPFMPQNLIMVQPQKFSLSFGPASNPAPQLPQFPLPSLAASSGSAAVKEPAASPASKKPPAAPSAADRAPAGPSAPVALSANEQAKKLIKDAQTLLRQNPAAAVEGLYREGLTLATEPYIKARLHFDLATTLNRFGTPGSLSAAIENYRQAISLKFDHVQLRSSLYIEYGRLLMKRKEENDIDQAILQFKEVLKLPYQGNYGAAYGNMGKCYRDYPKPSAEILNKAIESFKLAIPFNTTFWKAGYHVYLAASLEKRAQAGDLDEAKHNLLTALALKHSDKKLEKDAMLALNRIQQKRGII